MCCHPQNFEKHLKLLTRIGQVISIEKFFEIVESGRGFDRNFFVITFDDGFKDNCTSALPVLNKFQAPACVFLTTDMIDSPDLLPFHKLYFLLRWFDAMEIIRVARRMCPLLPADERSFGGSQNPIEFRNELEKSLGFDINSTKGRELVDYLATELCAKNCGDLAKRLYLSWDDVYEMATKGITFGSHTRSHRILSRLDLKEQETEILESKRQIEEKTGIEIRFFAYPFGYRDTFNDQTKKILTNSGFSLAFLGGSQGTNLPLDRLEVPRLLVGNMPIWEFAFELLISH